MKIGLVYTCVTPQLTASVEGEIKKQVGEVEFVSFDDGTILSDTVKAGYVSHQCAARLVTLYMKAAMADADAIVNVCSSVGDVSDACQDLAALMGIPLIRIDEEMCREAVRKGARIGVMATLPSTLYPTKRLIEKAAREAGKRVEIVDILVEGGFGLDPEQFLALMQDYSQKIADKVDVILFAQGSMAYAEESIAKATGKVVLSSPRFGAVQLKRALIAKGLIEA